MTIPREPRRPIQEPYESDEDFGERIDDYYKRLEQYYIACDMAVDEQRDRRCERGLFGEEL